MKLEKLVYGNTANKKSGKLREALTGNIKEHHGKEMELLRTIPGESHISSMIIIAETDANMSVFEASGKIASWAGLRPRNDENAAWNTPSYKRIAIIRY
jgi:transposase